MIQFTKRNLKVFFRDKTAVFFSLLAVFIVLGLYILFLGDVWMNSLEGITHARQLMDSWIMAGLLGVTSVTTTMGAFGIMIEDRSKKITKDFYTAPVKRSSIVGGYIWSAVIIGIIMSLITLIIAEIYLFSTGATLLGPVKILKVLLVIIVCTISNSAMLLFLVSFFKSEKAYSTASTIIGTLIGFLTGIYLPIGMLPDAVQFIVKIFPPSHGVVLFRQIMMDEPLDVSFAGIPKQYLLDFQEEMGVFFHFGDTVLSQGASLFILIGTAVVFFLLSVAMISRKKV